MTKIKVTIMKFDNKSDKVSHFYQFSKIKFLARFINHKAQQRNPTFEILRIFATLSVLIRHLKMMAFNSTPGGKGYRTVMFYHALSSTCDNIFIIVSGYFLAAQDLKITRLFPLIIENFTYSVGMYFFALAFGWGQFNKYELIHYLFPLSNGVYWFSAPFIISQIGFRPMYLGLQQLHPRYQLFLVIAANLVAFAATMNYGQHIGQWGIGACIYLFFQFLLIGAYIRMNNVTLSTKYCVIGIIVTGALHFYGIVGDLDKYLGKTTIIGQLIRSEAIYAPMPTLQTVFLLLVCQNYTITGLPAKIINFISDFNYGIYGVHCHSKVLHQFMGQFSPTKYVIFDSMFLHFLYATFGLYFECMIVECARNCLTNFLVYNTTWYNNFCDKIDNYLAPPGSENADIYRGKPDEEFLFTPV